jgi:hypothetical protein
MTVLAGFREVWTSTHGRAARYHIAIDGAAACATCPTLKSGTRRIILGDLINAEFVPLVMRCRRAACAKRWPTTAAKGF